MEKEKIMQLFANISSLHQFHSTHLLPALMESCREWHNTHRLFFLGSSYQTKKFWILPSSEITWGLVCLQKNLISKTSYKFYMSFQNKRSSTQTCTIFENVFRVYQQLQAGHKGVPGVLQKKTPLCTNCSRNRGLRFVWNTMKYDGIWWEKLKLRSVELHAVLVQKPKNF